MLVSVVSDPEVTQSSVTVVRKRPRPGEAHVSDYRRDLVQRIFEQMLERAVRRDLSRKPDAKFLDAGIDGGSLSPDVAMESLGGDVCRTERSRRGSRPSRSKRKRAREFGFGANEMDRARKWMAAFYERAYSERDKTESGSFAQEYLELLPRGRAEPGIAYEYQLVQQLLPASPPTKSSALAKTLLADDSRVILAVSPQKPGIKVPTEAELQGGDGRGRRGAVTAWNDTTATREIDRAGAGAGAISVDADGRRAGRDGRPLRQRRRGVAEADRFQERSGPVRDAGARAAPRWRRPTTFSKRSSHRATSRLSGAAGLKARRSAEAAGRQARQRVAVHRRCRRTASTDPPRRRSSRRRCSCCMREFTQPGDDPEAFELLKRQLDRRRRQPARNPMAVFSDKLDAVNSSITTPREPLTVERIGTLDRAKMLAFYKAALRNAADFTFFMVGAFKVDDVVPLLARYVGGLPSTPAQPARISGTSAFTFPPRAAATVEKGREPKGQTVISFFADPPHRSHGAGAGQRGQRCAGDRAARHPP